MEALQGQVCGTARDLKEDPMSGGQSLRSLLSGRSAKGLNFLFLEEPSCTCQENRACIKNVSQVGLE